MDGELSSSAVEALLDGDGLPDGIRIVDVRPRSAFEDAHIPGSECIPFAELPRAVDRLAGAERVVTVCPHGKASVRAARLVAAYDGLADDARVESMAGGLEGWEGELAAADGPEAATGTDDGDAGTPAEPTESEPQDAPF